MRYAFLVILGFGLTTMLAKEEAAAATILVVRIGSLSERGLHVVSSDRHFDLIECGIVDPVDYQRLFACLVLVPSEANKRFKNEEGRYAKLLLVETDLKERLEARLAILVPPSLPTAARPDDLGEATLASMHLPERDEDQN